MPSTYRRLCDNVRLNNLQDRVECCNVAAGAKDGTLRVTDQRGAENRVVPSESRAETVEVRVMPLEELWEQAGGDHFLVVKVDVEGWEQAVVSGASRLLARAGPTALVLELEGGARYGFDGQDVHEELCARGYVPVAHDPFSRELRKRDDFRRSGNTIYVSDIREATSRVKESEKYTVIDRNI
ncbi:FkbM family methyltransferase [Salinibacter ruber]|nr:FkbM family methyltransferase [Salinibacter ruber]